LEFILPPSDESDLCLKPIQAWSRRDMKSCYKSLIKFPIVIEIPVLFGDMDAFGHVNNTVYLRWFETARVQYLIRIGLWPKLPPEKVGPILAAISCDYKRPLTYPDAIYAGARVTSIGNSSFRMAHRVVSKSLNIVVAQGDSTIVTIDYHRNKAVPVPRKCRKAIDKLEGSGGDRLLNLEIRDNLR
jgi:acyl-CoA thioester hydrolase